MANLLDYIAWRGDLTFRQSPFNEVDNLIFAELAFVDFRGIVPGIGEGDGILLREAADVFFSAHSAGEKIDMGILIPAEIPEMLRKMAAAPRYQNVKLSCFTDRNDAERVEQFAALTAETGDGALYLAFRGTDDTLAGWKEDFNMSFMAEIPSQKLAVEYVRAVARRFPRRKLRLGGHSKGGNLAVYAAVFSPAIVQRRIERVWSNDGPGFREDLSKLPQYQRLADRITSIVPKSSVVGMILQHEEDYAVVDSSQQGLFQHDGFSWEVLGNSFVRLHGVTRQGRIHDLVLKEWVRNMSLAQREKFVEGLFAVLESSGAQTLTELKSDRFKAALAMVKAMKDMEKETRDALLYAIRLLFQSNLKVLAGELQQESERRQKKKIQKKEDS